MTQKKNKNEEKKPGPKARTLKIEDDIDWTDALKHALHKSKPKEGWPDRTSNQSDETKQSDESESERG